VIVLQIWVLLRRAYESDELLGAFRDSPVVFEDVAAAHPTLSAGRWATVSPDEFRLRDPRVDPDASYSLIRTTVP
jgi:hypothetical protein